MARFYSNENLAIELVESLRSLGHDVLTSYDAGQANQGIPDEAVLAYATAQQRSVITFNRDDFLMLHRQGIEHAGIVICKDARDYSDQVRSLNEHLCADEPSLQNRLLRVQKLNQRGSAEQVFVVREYLR